MGFLATGARKVRTSTDVQSMEIPSMESTGVEKLCHKLAAESLFRCYKVLFWEQGGSGGDDGAVQGGDTVEKVSTPWPRGAVRVGQRAI